VQRMRTHINSYRAKCVQILCQNCVTYPVKPWAHTVIWGHVDAYRCCGKSLIGSALVEFGVRQHARRELISKRAPSTTRTSLRLSGINSLPEGGEPCKSKL
jgi:hypothetical protein